MRVARGGHRDAGGEVQEEVAVDVLDRQALPADRPWTRHEGGDDLGGLIRELNMAAIQVSRVGTPTARDEARKVLTDARRALYRLLAEDESAAGTSDEATTRA